MTPTEREEFKQEIIEEMTLFIPELVNAMVSELGAQVELNKNFYAKHPEFKGHEHIVRSVIGSMADPLKDYKDILKDAPAKIRERINTMKSIDVSNVNPNPDLTLGNGVI